ncbi:MAG TPA: hypothetical protein VGR64_03560 [Terracidiphilus sp.]|nr:hypothetical protein [Terracidiphilus sp.]
MSIAPIGFNAATPVASTLPVQSAAPAHASQQSAVLRSDTVSISSQGKAASQPSTRSVGDVDHDGDSH